MSTKQQALKIIHKLERYRALVDKAVSADSAARYASHQENFKFADKLWNDGAKWSKKAYATWDEAIGMLWLLTKD